MSLQVFIESLIETKAMVLDAYASTSDAFVHSQMLSL